MPKSFWADFDGNKLHYHDIGKRDKKAIVFIHGWTGNTELWRESYSAFPKYRVIVVDLVGHGQSGKPKVEYTMEYFAKGLDAVLKKAKVSKAILVGHSMGMPVSREYYRSYPDKVAGIVNVDGSFHWFPEEEKQWEEFLAQLRTDYHKTRKMFLAGMLQPIKDEKVKLAIQTSNDATPDYVGMSALNNMGSKELWKTDPIRVPVLAVLAASPSWPADTEALHRSISPDLEFHMWTGVSHFLFMDRPKEFNDLLLAFIEKRKLL